LAQDVFMFEEAPMRMQLLAGAQPDKEPLAVLAQQ
jgi:hypothetical protein